MSVQGARSRQFILDGLLQRNLLKGVSELSVFYFPLIENRVNTVLASGRIHPASGHICWAEIGLT